VPAQTCVQLQLACPTAQINPPVGGSRIKAHLILSVVLARVLVNSVAGGLSAQAARPTHQRTAQHLQQGRQAGRAAWWWAWVVQRATLSPRPQSGRCALCSHACQSHAATPGTRSLCRPGGWLQLTSRLPSRMAHGGLEHPGWSCRMRRGGGGARAGLCQNQPQTSGLICRGSNRSGSWQTLPAACGAAPERRWVGEGGFVVGTAVQWSNQAGKDAKQSHLAGCRQLRRAQQRNERHVCRLAQVAPRVVLVPVHALHCANYAVGACGAQRRKGGGSSRLSLQGTYSHLWTYGHM